MPKLTLVEGLPKYDGINEAQTIADALNIMKKGLDGRRSRHLNIRPIRANSKTEFTKGLERETDFLHVSSHGEKDEFDNTYLYVTNGGCIYPKDIEKLKIKAKVVFLNACLASREDMATAFLDANNPKYRFFIAPKKDVTFDEAFIASLLFYRNAFLKNIDIKSEQTVYQALKKVYKLGDIRTNYFFWRARKLF
jgi:hypothetical protein